jgi:elongation factor G
MNILFKETIRVESRGYHKLKKQNGGPGQFAVVDLFVRPLPRGGGFRFLNSVVEGRVPEEFVPSVEKGAKEAFMKGVLAGFPVVDVEVELVDGERHRKDSHARDFQIAGRTAVQEALQAASPALLEPIGSLEVTCPTRSFGDVLGQLRRRRTRICGTDFRNDLHVIQGEIPLLELTGFDSDLRSLTNGTGTVVVAYSRDEVMLGQIQARILEQLRPRI